ncbi:MAG: hypothetical protein IT379_30425 [Deltaproteobacteria bacterium]|nr:hypothetical protein [Deltaproteobacteria bacterium]
MRYRTSLPVAAAAACWILTSMTRAQLPDAGALDATLPPSTPIVDAGTPDAPIHSTRGNGDTADAASDSEVDVCSLPSHVDPVTIQRESAEWTRQAAAARGLEGDVEARGGQAIASRATLGVPQSSLHFEQDEDDSRLTGEIGLRFGPHILSADLQTAELEDGEGTLFSADSGLGDGAELGLRYTYWSFYDLRDFRARDGRRLECACWDQGLDVRERPCPDDEARCRDIVGPQWRFSAPTADAQDCSPAELDGRHRRMVADVPPTFLFTIRIAASRRSIDYVAEDMGMFVDRESTEHGVSGSLGIGFFPLEQLLVAVSTEARRRVRTPEDHPTVCRNQPIAGMASDPAVLACDERYLEPLATGWRWSVRAEIRGYLGSWIGANPSVTLRLYDELANGWLSALLMESPIYLWAGEDNPINFGVRPSVTIDLHDPSDTEVGFSVFLGATFGLVKL